MIEVTKRIRNYGKAGKLKMAIGELAQCARLGIKPDVQAATALLSACVSNKKMDMAEALFEELFGEFQRFNPFTAESLLSQAE